MLSPSWALEFPLMVVMGIGGAAGETSISWSFWFLLWVWLWVSLAKEMIIRRCAKARTASQLEGVTDVIVWRKRGMAMS